MGPETEDARPATGEVDLVTVMAERPTSEFDDVKVQADYTARAMLSFYRFRQLGGGQMPKHRRRNKDDANAQDEVPPRNRKLRLGEVIGRGVHYVSDHPDVRILQLSVIALLVLFESAANAYFFAQQSEFGISGGLFQAAAVSIANVAVSFFIVGYWGLRHASTPVDWTWKPWDWEARDYYKLFGFFAIIAGVTVVLLVNLSAAHYRNLIDLAASHDLNEAIQAVQSNEAHPLTYVVDRDFKWPWVDDATCEAVLNSEIGLSIGGAATNAMCRPFAIHSLDAMVLFALGLAISALAAFEGRGADASFPGLSDAAREFEKARVDLQDALDEYYEAIEDWVLETKRLAVGDPLDEDEKGDESLKGEGYQKLSRDEELRLRTLLRQKVEPYRALLTSDSDILSDEFGVDQDIVDRFVSRLLSSGDR